MLSEGVLQQQFTERILGRDTSIILEEQRSAASALLHTRTGRLMNSLGGTMKLISAGPITIAQQSYPIYLRFLDIKLSKKGKSSFVSLYNRVIWKTLYSKTLQSLRTEYNKTIEEAIYNNFKQK